MSKKNPHVYNPTHLLEAIKKWTIPMHDKKHGYYIHIEEKARSNQTRVEHIARCGHDLKARDLELVPQGINNYFEYRKDPVYKNTYNYYIPRAGMDKGFIKVSIRICDSDNTYAWIKTIYITYKIK